MTIEELLGNPELLEIARKKVEDVLIQMRDARIARLFMANGLVCREANGDDSYIIRLSIDDALRIGLNAVLDHQKEKKEES
jgi:hypothetical protein